MVEIVSAPTARRIALAAQGFSRRRPATPSTRSLHAAMGRMGVLQIDSVNVFARSHYLPFFSRLGAYDTATADRLLFDAQGPYTEYWAHAATLMPTADWPLWQFRMDAWRRDLEADGWYHAHRSTIDWIKRELTERGPLRPAEIEQDVQRTPRGPWWDWSEVKSTLERLFLAGEVAIAGRRGFERRYALTEHVIPTETLARTWPLDEAIRELARRAMRSSGIATAADVADYYRVRDRTAVRKALDELTEAGELEQVQVRGWDRGGKPIPAWLHRDAAVPRRIDATALLTPFDPVVWFRDRAERMFDFEYRIEIYTPAAKRVYGYYSLPVLVGDRIVGRVDLKAHRQASTLLVQSAWWEQESHCEHAGRIADELRMAARWQGLEHISVGSHGDATDHLADALGPRGTVPRHVRAS